MDCKIIYDVFYRDEKALEEFKSGLKRTHEDSNNYDEAKKPKADDTDLLGDLK